MKVVDKRTFIRGGFLVFLPKKPLMGGSAGSGFPELRRSNEE
jgi:hypothetical protein